MISRPIVGNYKDYRIGRPIDSTGELVAQLGIIENFAIVDDDQAVAQHGLLVEWRQVNDRQGSESLSI